VTSTQLLHCDVQVRARIIWRRRARAWSEQCLHSSTNTSCTRTETATCWETSESKLGFFATIFEPSVEEAAYLSLSAVHDLIGCRSSKKSLLEILRDLKINLPCFWFVPSMAATSWYFRGRQNDCNSLFYYFRGGQNDCNFLFYYFWGGKIISTCCFTE